MTKVLLVSRVAVTLLVFASSTRLIDGVHIADHMIGKKGLRPALRICADPNNLPFSNNRGEGFENRLAKLIAADLGIEIVYFWWAQHRGHIRNTLVAGHCDVILGIGSTTERALTTAPYYRSTYVFVTRRDRNLVIDSLDSFILRQVRIGVHLVGDDGANTPPVHALQLRNLAGNLRGFSLTGDYTEQDPPARLLEAVVDGRIDVALSWGPLAGYFAQQRGLPLQISPISHEGKEAFPPMTYDISMGVRRQDRLLRDRLDKFLAHRRAEVDRLLNEYGIPRVNSHGQFLWKKTL